MTFHMKGNNNIFLQLLTGKNPKFKDGKHYCTYTYLNCGKRKQFKEQMN